MTPELRLRVADQGGVFTRAQALTCGFSLDEAQRAVAQGDWHRLRRGAYIESAAARTLSAKALHVRGLHAVNLQLQHRVVGSHDTAAAVLDLEVWEPSYDWIHITRPMHSSRREGGIWHHRGLLTPDDVRVANGLTVTSALRTALDMARVVDFEHGVVVLDSALRQSGASIESLRELHVRQADWSGARAAGRAIAFADPRSGSVGESRTRVGLAALGLPAPQTQVTIEDDAGRFVARVDFLLNGSTILEFDGRSKYGMDGLTAEAMSDRLWQEKLREDALRPLGYEVVRLTWADLRHRDRIRVRVRDAMARAEASGPIRGRSTVAPLRQQSTGAGPVEPVPKSAHGA